MRKLWATLVLIFLSNQIFALPSKAYLSVPFLCQAPSGNWGQPWQDACEEAAIVMAMKYVKGEELGKKAAGVPFAPWALEGRQEILKLVGFQNKNYGGHYDLNAEQIAKLIKDYYQYHQIEVCYDITIDDIKKELAEGNVVIAPMAGRLLGNPYYTPPGPAYHNMLFIGYDDQVGKFIANDAGTKRGRNYRYKYKVAYNAIHDWTGNKKTISKGRRAIIIVKLK